MTPENQTPYIDQLRDQGFLPYRDLQARLKAFYMQLEERIPGVTLEEASKKAYERITSFIESYGDGLFQALGKGEDSDIFLVPNAVTMLYRYKTREEFMNMLQRNRKQMNLPQHDFKEVLTEDDYRALHTVAREKVGGHNVDGVILQKND